MNKYMSIIISCLIYGFSTQGLSLSIGNRIDKTVNFRLDFSETLCKEVSVNMRLTPHKNNVTRVDLPHKIFSGCCVKNIAAFIEGSNTAIVEEKLQSCTASGSIILKNKDGKYVLDLYQ